MATVREGSKRGLWIVLAILAVIVIVVVAFFALGGDADVDSEGGDIDLPETDVDVEPPDIEGDVDAEEGGDAEAEVEG